MLEIEDGGPNDADGLANGRIVDPSGVSELISQLTVSIDSVSAVTEGDSFTLNATLQLNGNDVASSLWTQTSGPAATITNADQLSATVTNAPEGSLSFRITVTDMLGRTSQQSVSVTVNASAPPPPPPSPSPSGGGGGGAVAPWLILLMLLNLYSRGRRQRLR